MIYYTKWNRMMNSPYFGQSDDADHAAVRGRGVRRTQGPRYQATDSLCKQPTVYGVRWRHRYITDPTGCDVITHGLNNWHEHAQDHPNENVQAERRAPELTWKKIGWNKEILSRFTKVFYKRGNFLQPIIP